MVLGGMDVIEDDDDFGDFVDKDDISEVENVE